VAGSIQKEPESRPLLATAGCCWCSRRLSLPPEELAAEHPPLDSLRLAEERHWCSLKQAAVEEPRLE